MKYEYKCSNCNEVLIIEHGVNDPRHTKCSICNKDTLSRYISRATPTIYKGDNWVSKGNKY